jgi:hypothetical protein
VCCATVGPPGPDSAQPGVGEGSASEGSAALEVVAGLSGGVGVAAVEGVAALEAGAEFDAGAADESAHAEIADNEAKAATPSAMAEVRGTL